MTTIAKPNLTKDERDENTVMRRVIKDALAQGWSITVCDGEDYPLKDSRDAKAVFGAMKSTDADILHFRGEDGIKVGWVHFVYGNSGWEVVSDYSTRIETFMAPINEYAEKFDR